MLTNAADDVPDLTNTSAFVTRAGQLATRKIWLPRLVYDSLPYFYLTSGFAALFATLYISEWFWVLPHYLLFSAGCLHLALAVFRRRRLRNQRPNELAADEQPSR